MPREMRIAITAELPDGIFEEAARINALQPMFARLKEEFGELAVIEVDVVVPRSRAAKDGETTT